MEGHNLAQKDLFSASDPYLYITFGEKVFDEKQHALTDEPNPKFNKQYVFEAMLPGAPTLRIEVRDDDGLFGYDSIGSTSIDIDDRFFCPQWKELEHKPIEQRDLFTPSTGISQGQISMWLDIERATKEEEKEKNKLQGKEKKSEKLKNSKEKLWDISPEPPGEYEVRVCVFGTSAVPQ